MGPTPNFSFSLGSVHFVNLRKHFACTFRGRHDHTSKDWEVRNSPDANPSLLLFLCLTAASLFTWTICFLLNSGRYTLYDVLQIQGQNMLTFEANCLPSGGQLLSFARTKGTSNSFVQYEVRLYYTSGHKAYLRPCRCDRYNIAKNYGRRTQLSQLRVHRVTQMLPDHKESHTYTDQQLWALGLSFCTYRYTHTHTHTHTDLWSQNGNVSSRWHCV